VNKLEVLTLATAIVGAVTGVLGAALGLVNTWDLLRKNKVRLRVVPKLTHMVNGSFAMNATRSNPLTKRLIEAGHAFRLSVEVVNLSTFPVTVSEIGFGRPDEDRYLLAEAELSPGKTWPIRLESREAVTAYGAIGVGIDPRVLKKPVAFALTECGSAAYGSSPIFEHYLGQIPEADKGGK